MTQIVHQLADPAGWLVLAGGGLQACAHLFKNQIVLRMVLLAGTIHYIAYYFAATEQPLWPAILATSVLAIGTLVGLFRALPSSAPAPRVEFSQVDEKHRSDRAELRVVEN